MWAAMRIHGEWLRVSTTKAVAWIQAAHINQTDNWEAMFWPATLAVFLRWLGRRPSIKMKGKGTTTVQPCQWLCSKLAQMATRPWEEEEEVVEEEGDGRGHVPNKQWHPEVTVEFSVLRGYGRSAALNYRLYLFFKSHHLWWLLKTANHEQTQAGTS